MIKVHNVRLGFACNSSSTHSIIKAGTASGDSELNEFGWNWFLQETKEEKTRYFAQSLFNALTYYNNLSETIALAIVKDLFPLADKPLLTEGYVDHQSVIIPPWDVKNPNIPMVDFYKELADSIIEDDTLHILGGNDNDGDPTGSVQSPDHIWLHNIKEVRCWVARKEVNGMWTLFNRHTGTKLRVSFKEVAPSLPTVPELVDLKITNQCFSNCAFCYQHSTPQGEHAPLSRVKSVLYHLAYEGVFEVALGGGEPVLHPDFLEILEYGKSLGISMTYTTNTLTTLSDKAFRKSHNYARAFAISVPPGNSLERIREAAEAYEECTRGMEYYAKPQLSFQIITDLFSKEALASVGSVDLYMRLTLLGYKDCGAETPFRRPIEWLKPILENPGLILGVDTKFAQDYPSLMEKFPPETYYTNEGEYSMYIDAVTESYGPSSYHPTTKGDVHTALTAFKKKEWP